MSMEHEMKWRKKTDGIITKNGVVSVEIKTRSGGTGAAAHFAGGVDGQRRQPIAVAATPASAVGRELLRRPGGGFAAAAAAPASAAAAAAGR